jgi:iron complex outermembrane receptor protein
MRKTILFCTLTLSQVALAQNEPDLTSLSLEQLGDIEISTASRREEKLLNTPASVFVLTGEDIRRSGVTSIPEALRLVPGLSVARSNSSTWAISARGFNEIFANKLLVMVDGRTVYTPVFSGTYWDAQDYKLSDIDRIEVVKGPGGTLWGVNAVNGVIHIITKNAKDTHGGEVVAGAGTNDGPTASMRYGDSLGADSDYRLYVKTRKIESSENATGGDADDQWSSVQGGFRIDGGSKSETEYSVHGDTYKGINSFRGTVASRDFPFNRDYSTKSDFSGGNLVGRLKTQTGDNSELTVQGYFDRVNRASFENGFHGNTYDLDLQHNFKFGREALTYGLNYRVVDDRFYGSELIRALDPESRVYRNYSAFVQGNIELIEDELSLILGTKFEHSGLSGGALSPSARALWKLGGDTVAWAAVSRGVRAASRVQHDVTLDISPFNPNAGGIPGITRVFSDPDTNPEVLISYDTGVRFSASSDLSFDISAFTGDYKDITLLKSGSPFVGEFRGGPAIINPLTRVNEATARTTGAEVTTEWRPQSWSRLVLSYSYFDIDLNANNPSDYADFNDVRGGYPTHQVVARAQCNFGEHWEFDPTFRYVDALRTPSVDSYFNLDIRLGYKFSDDLDLSLIGQNLLEEDRIEFGGSPLGVPSSLVERGVFGRLTWRF